MHENDWKHVERLSSTVAERVVEQSGAIKYMPATMAEFSAEDSKGTARLDGDDVDLPVSVVVPNFKPEPGARVMVAALDTTMLVIGAIDPVDTIPKKGGVPTNITPDAVAAEGTSILYSPEKHVHGLTANNVPTLNVGHTSAEGAVSAVARSDHQHGVPTGTPVAVISGAPPSAGSSTSFPRLDHQHGIAAGAEAASVAGMIESSVTQSVATGAEPVVVYGGPARIAAGVTWDGAINVWTIVTAGRYVPRARTKVLFTAEGYYYQHLIRLFNLSFKSLTANVVTLTSPQPHHVMVGDQIVVDSVGAPYDGTYTVNDAPTPTTFTYTKVNANLAQTATTGRVATRLDDDHPPWLRGAPFTPPESGLVTSYVSRPCQASAGDRFYITFFQSSGAAATIQPHDTWFGIDRVGP